MLSFTGGGFALDITTQHLEFWHRIKSDLAKSGVDIAIYFPIYTLTPHSAYPTQLQQAAGALTYVLEHLGRDPEDVIIAGDSAGANLCVGLISHLSHPSADLPRLKIDNHLLGMILISPWLSFDTSWPSMTKNAKRDIDAIEPLEKWARSYVNGKASTSYIEAVTASMSWWTGAHVKQTVVLAGADEVFIDSTRAWTETFKVSFTATMLKNDWLISVGGGKCDIL